MRRRIWLCYLGAVLLVSAAPLFAGSKKARQSSSSSSSASASTTKKTTTAKKRVRAKSVARPVVQQAPTADRIREIQSALIRDGALSGDPTGKWDPTTVSAMQKFQTENGLDPTGKIDALSLQKLGLGSEIAGKAPPTTPTAPLSGPPESGGTPLAPSGASTPRPPAPGASPASAAPSSTSP